MISATSSFFKFDEFQSQLYKKYSVSAIMKTCIFTEYYFSLTKAKLKIASNLDQKLVIKLEKGRKYRSIIYLSSVNITIQLAISITILGINYSNSYNSSGHSTLFNTTISFVLLIILQCLIAFLKLQISIYYLQYKLLHI